MPKEKEPKYFTIHSSDGDVYVQERTKEELEEMFNNSEDYGSLEAMQGLAKEDTAYWKSDEILIIKGEIVVPQYKKAVFE